MTQEINSYSRKYEMPLPDGIYGKIVDSLPKIHGVYPDHLFVRGSSKNPEDLILIQRDYKKMKEIVKIHSKEPETVQLHLEKITGVKLSDYRVD
ncbi:MAG: hypothetical protein Q8O84_01325 [Nanoarchaeota archaeon]|nr:hypothetical protein [Nanoarchaeota archaeon]